MIDERVDERLKQNASEFYAIYFDPSVQKWDQIGHSNNMYQGKPQMSFHHYSQSTKSALRHYMNPLEKLKMIQYWSHLLQSSPQDMLLSNGQFDFANPTFNEMIRSWSSDIMFFSVSRITLIRLIRLL